MIAQNSYSQTSTASQYVARFAADIGVRHNDSDVLTFNVDGGPDLVLESLADGSAALHANLGMAPRGGHEEEAPLHALLQSNAPGRAGDVPIAAIDPFGDELLLFQRVEGLDHLPFEAFTATLMRFAGAAARRRDGYRTAEVSAADMGDESANGSGREDFRQLWAEYVYQSGLRSGDDVPDDECSYLLPMDGGGFLAVEYEAGSATVLLKSVLAWLPLEGFDDEPVLRQLLEAHLLGEATGGACFAIDPDHDELIAYRRIAIQGLDAQMLRTQIEELGTTTLRFAAMLRLKLPGAGE